jgi:hypothetical protein
MRRWSVFSVLCILQANLFVVSTAGQSVTQSFHGWIHVEAHNNGQLLGFQFNNTFNSVSPFLQTTVTAINTTGYPSQQIFDLKVCDVVYEVDYDPMLTGPEYNLITSAKNFSGALFQDEFSPCAAPFLQQRPFSLVMGPTFAANITLSVKIDVVVQLRETTIRPTDSVPVPQASNQFFSFFPMEEGPVNVFLSLTAVQPNATVNQQVNRILVGCDSNQQIIDLATEAVTQWSFTLTGVVSPIIIELVAVEPLPAQPGFVFQVTSEKENEKDSRLTDWQIGLITVGGVVTVIIVAGIVGFIVYLKRRTPYKMLN